MMSNPRKPTPLFTHLTTEELPKPFKAKGILSIRGMNQFLVVGNDKKTERGHLRLYSSDLALQTTGSSTCIEFSLATELSLQTKDKMPIILTTGRDDVGFLAYQAWHAATLSTVYPPNSHGAILTCVDHHLPPPILEPTPQALATVQSARNFSPNGWRLGSGTIFKMSLSKRYPVITHERAIPSSTQSIAYAPDYKHVITISENAAVLDTIPQTRTVPLGVRRQRALCNAWFSDATHFLTGHPDGTISLGHTQYPRAVSLHVGLNVHAIQTIDDEPTIVCAHADGSVRVYHLEAAMERLHNEGKALPAQDAKSALPSQDLKADAIQPSIAIVTPTKNWLEKAFLADAHVELATLTDSNTTKLVVHERGTQCLNLFSMPRMHTAIEQRISSLGILPPDIDALIASYATSSLRMFAPIKAHRADTTTPPSKEDHKKDNSPTPH